MVNSHNEEGGNVALHPQSYRLLEIFLNPEKPLRQTGRNDNDLAALLQVRLVDETAGAELNLVHILYVNVAAAKADGSVLLSVGDVQTLIHYRSNTVNYSRKELAFKQIHIPFLQDDCPSRLETVIRLGRIGTHYIHSIQVDIAHTPAHRVHQAVSGAQQHN